MVGTTGGVLVADAHPLSCQGLVALVAQHIDGCTTTEAHDASAVAVMLSAGAFRLLLIDFDLPDLHAAEGLRAIRARFPAVLVVVAAATRCRTRVLEALGAGVHGYILKDSPLAEMRDALRTVLAGHIYVPTLVTNISPAVPPVAKTADHDVSLTDRQNEVLALLSHGHSNKEIARLLQIAEGTVKVHVAAAFRSLGVHNRVSAVAAIHGQAFARHGPDDPMADVQRDIIRTSDSGAYRASHHQDLSDTLHAYLRAV